MADKTTIMKEAQKYLAKGQIDKAIGEWEKLIKEYPDGNAYNSIGDLYLKKGDKKNAVESYDKAANFFRHEGFTLKALALYKKVLNIDSSNANALFALGELSEEKGIVTDAVKNYLAAADSIMKQGKTEDAIEIYEKILALSPSNVPLRNKVAEILMNVGLRGEACKQYVQIANLYLEKGDRQKAGEHYQKVLDLQPKNRDAVIGISMLAEQGGDLQGAMEKMIEATALFPEDSGVLMRCAELAMSTGMVDEAKSYLEKVNAIDPENVKGKRLLADMYLGEGDRDRAFAEYMPVIDSIILEENFDEAVQLLHQFRDVDPVETGRRLFSIYKQQGDNENAVAAMMDVADAFLQDGSDDEAISVYNEALEIFPENDFIREKITQILQAKEAAAAAAAEPVGVSPGEEAVAPEEESFEVPGEETRLPSVEEQMATMAEPPPPEAAAPPAEHVRIQVEKPFNEVMTEADIFSRYGLLGEARRLFEGLRQRDPENIEVREKLKILYVEMSDRESAVTECLALKELYEKSGDSGSAERTLQDAYEISPDDPRLPSKAGDFPGPEAETVPGEALSEMPEGLSREDHEEEIAEAEFYARQGLVDEAVEIFQKLRGLFPDDEYFRNRLVELSSEEVEQPEEEPERGVLAPEGIAGEVEPETVEAAVEEPAMVEEEEYEDFSLTDEDFVEAEEVPEPQLDNDVMDIFNEFKKGIEEELGEEDSETHYNLGIAYKEMGLVDDAIKAFQTARNDPKHFLQASTMLGACYMDKGMHSLAIGALENAISTLGTKDDAYWAMKYDLAIAYEKNNNIRDALEIFTEVYGWNAKFRDIAVKINELKSRVAESTPKEKTKEKTKEKRDRVSYL